MDVQISSNLADLMGKCQTSSPSPLQTRLKQDGGERLGEARWIQEEAGRGDVHLEQKRWYHNGVRCEKYRNKWTLDRSPLQIFIFNLFRCASIS